MKVINIQNIKGTEYDVPFTGGNSYRIVRKEHGVGFSINKTHIPKGGANRWHYLHHYESCYCISGYGILTNLKTGEKYEIKPDILYILDNHDDHTFQAIKDTILISVFNPPLSGKETHDKDGVYSLDFDKEPLYALAEKVFACNNKYDAADLIINHINYKL